jgi:tellurite resistance protein
MPFSDPEARRRYDRERRRLERASRRSSVTALHPQVRLRMASDVEAILAQAVDLARNDGSARDVEKARALTQIASVALRLVETSDLAARLEALEQVLKLRRPA